MEEILVETLLMFTTEWKTPNNLTHLQQNSDLLLHSCLRLRALSRQVGIGHHTQLEDRRSNTYEIRLQVLESAFYSDYQPFRTFQIGLPSI